jgi:DNA polymerase III subunit delta
MVAIKAQSADSFLAAPDPRLSAVLLYGTDAGLIAERARLLARLLAERDNPAGEIVRLDEADLDRDPDRLAVELQTMPMFGGRKIVRVATGRRVNAAALKPLLEAGTLAGSLIVEAGNLRPDDALRSLFERSSAGAAVGCYGDETRDLAGMIADILQAANLTITPEAQQQLTSRLGADRALSRSEVDKLALYAADKGVIDIDDVETIVGDAAELALDRLINAAGLGRADQALVEADRVFAAGESPQTVILAIQRHFLRLHRTRIAMDAGRDLQDIVRQMRPPLHFRQRPAFEAQCRRWTAAGLEAALAAIATAATAARLNSALEAVLAERLVLDLAALPGPQSGGRSRA